MTIQRNYAKLIMLLVLGLSVASCASLSKNECLNANWHSIGYSDGVRGYKANRQGQHRSACAEHNVRIDLDLYLQGRSEGLRQYCVPYNAYKTGVNGFSFNDVCPVEWSPNFYTAFRDGQDVYHLKVNMAKKRERHVVVHDKLHHLHEDKNKLYLLLGDKQKTKLERRLIKKEIRLLKREIELYEHRLGRLSRRINYLQVELNLHQSNARDRWLRR